MYMTTSEIAAALGTTTERSATATTASTDSRAIEPGALFIALRGVRDGHDYIDAALKAGAVAFLTDRYSDDPAAIQVPDTLTALGQLAEIVRVSLDATVVGVTGSVGKTTTKDMLATILAANRRTSASIRSYNNNIGVPLTILNAPRGVEILVLEIGANAPGEIASLSDLAAPDVGVVTTVAPAHTLGFGDVKGVALEKSELVASLPPGGLAVLNADVPLVAGMAGRSAAPVLTFGLGATADVMVEVVERSADLRPYIRLVTPWGQSEGWVGAAGDHQALNAAAAIAVGGGLGLDLDDLTAALADLTLSPHRMAVISTAEGALILDDSYNANPASMEAGLRALAATSANRRIALVGVMAELGESSDDEHRCVTALADELGIELIAIDAPSYGCEVVPDIDAAVARVGRVGSGDALLVKGSRVAGLERLVARLSSK